MSCPLAQGFFPRAILTEDSDLDLVLFHKVFFERLSLDRGKRSRMISSANVGCRKGPLVAVNHNMRFLPTISHYQTEASMNLRVTHDSGRWLFEIWLKRLRIKVEGSGSAKMLVSGCLIFGSYRDNRKENGNHYSITGYILGLYKDT